MPDETDTQQMPQEPPEPTPRRRLERSSTDKMIAGVAGGIGRHLNVDPLAIRITFVILTFAGGFGLLAYLACLVLVPSDDPEAEPLQWGLWRTLGAGLLAVAAIAVFVPDWLWGPELGVLLIAGAILYVLIRVVRDDGASHMSSVAAKLAIGIVLLALSVGGFAAAAAGSALGGGIAVAGLIIACGVGLVGGAFRGGARWLIGPALVLAVPLAAVAATDLDLRGTWGERTFTPTTLAEVERGYDMGAGSMRVDLRDVEFPPGRTTLPLDLGAGEIQVLVPSDLCVLTDARVRMGAVDDGRDEQGGVDLDVVDRRAVAPGTRAVRLDVDLGLGAVVVGDRFLRDRPHGNWHFDGGNGYDAAAACAGTP